MLTFADIQAVQDRYSPERGVPKYTQEFAETASRIRPDLVNQWLLRRGEPVPPSLLHLFSSGAVQFLDEIATPPDIIHNLAPFQRVGSGIDSDDLLDHRLTGPGTKVVATVYDLIPLLYPQVYFRNQVFRDDYLLATAFLEYSDLILTISDSAARDVVQHLGVDPRKVVSVGTGVPGSFEPASDRDLAFELLRAKFPTIRRGFLLYVGGIDFRKNMDGALRSFALLDAATRRAHPLVVVCRLVGDSGRYLKSMVKKLGIKNDVILTDLVDDQTLERLYQATDLFLFPSLYEGFGLPVVEALRSGAPVVVGDNSSLRDIVTLAEARFDASDPSAIAATIMRTLESEESRTRTLREVDTSQHTWEVVVENTAEAYRRLKPTRRSPARRRLAFVTPLPPAATGIAIYDERLIRSLSELIDVDVFAQPEAHQLEMPGVRQFDYGAFPAQRLVEDYFDVVFAMGNSYFHLNEFELLSRYGGTVMLHDVRITGLLNNILAMHPRLLSAETISELEELKRFEFPKRLGPYPAFEFPDQIQANALMSQVITSAAHRVLLHSAAGRSIAQLEAKPHESSRVTQISLAFAGPDRIRSENPDAVTSFGYLHRTKQTPLLCEAFVLAAQELPDLTFAFVGYLGDSELRAEMDAMIKRAGVVGRVIVTGWQSESEYSDWLARSVLTIQPRVNFNGEASAAVTESIGAGVPTVVSDIGWMGELPDDVVSKMPTTISARQLANLIIELVRDKGRLEEMSTNGILYAADHSFDAVAQTLLSIISADHAARRGV